MVVNFISDFCFPGGIPVHQAEIASILSEKYGCEMRICVPWPLRYDMDEHKNFIYNTKRNGGLEKIYPPLKFLTAVHSNEIQSIIQSADINHFHGSFSTNRSFLGEAIDSLSDKNNTYYTFHSEKINPKCGSDETELLRRLEKIDTIFAVSSGVKKSVEQIVSNREVIITPNGYSLSENYLKKKDHPFTILFIGRLNKTKGIENIINFAQRIQNSDLRLIIVGASEFEKKYDMQLETLSDSKNIIWIKKTLSKSSVLKLYSVSDVFYFPSHMEGSPLVVLDAIANGCVPVVSYAGSLKEIIKHRSNGFIFDYDNFEGQYSAVMELSRDRILYQSIRQNVLKTKLPSWEETADMLIKIYRKEYHYEKGNY